MPISTATLLGKLRLHKPHYVLVETSDAEEPTKINMSAARQRAQRMINQLDDIPWTVVTMYDKGGGFLGKHPRGPEDEPTDGELADLSVSPQAARRMEFDHTLTKTYEFARECMKEQRIASQPLIDGLVRVIEITGVHLSSEREANAAQKSENNKVHQQLINTLYQVAADKAAAAAEAASGDGDDIDSQIISMIPAALQAMKPSPAAAAAPTSSASSSAARSRTGARNAPPVRVRRAQ